jgi:hypothetical protein
MERFRVLGGILFLVSAIIFSFLLGNMSTKLTSWWTVTIQLVGAMFIIVGGLVLFIGGMRQKIKESEKRQQQPPPAPQLNP